MSEDKRKVFQATYSGIRVYEMLCKGIAVMRRKTDSYLNATQILKVAGFEKLHRTRILEREVQTGHHEKVQGGYGKYQGTWVPLERGTELAEQYQVIDLLDPIIHYVQGEKSPPLAPKHTTAQTAKTKKIRESRPMRKKAKTNYAEEHVLDDFDTLPQIPPPVKKELVQLPLKRTRQQMERKVRTIINEEEKAEKEELAPRIKNLPKNTLKNSTKNPSKSLTKSPSKNSTKSSLKTAPVETVPGDKSIVENNETRDKNYSQKLLKFFMSSTEDIPTLITHPPQDFDLNITIDNEGHTSLHWAASMARIKVVVALMDKKADIHRVNYMGQTALMRSVQLTNNFEEKSFDTLLAILRPTVFNIDKNDQTVFHHIATTSGHKGKLYASRYYLELLINQLKKNRAELISILNVQDTHGDTALTISARTGNKSFIKLLIDAGASTEIANEDEMTAKDYIEEMERNSANEPPSLFPFHPTRNILINDIESQESLRQKVDTMFKQVAPRLDNIEMVPSIPSVFDSFAESYERDLLIKEDVLQKNKIKLELYTKRLEEAKRVLETQSFDTKDTMEYEEVRNRGLLLYKRLGKWLEFSQRQTLQCLLQLAERSQQSSSHQSTHSNGNSTLEELDQLKKKSVLLRQELTSLQKSRIERVKKLTDLLSQEPSKKYQEYKRLIATSCNITYEETESMMEPLLNLFEKGA